MESEKERTGEGGAPPALAAIRERLADRRGPELWRSLDELAATPEFQDWLHREFPRQASEWVEPPGDGVSRRRFLQLSGASLALAGLTACTKQPLERIVPYVKQPEEIVQGRPLYFATTFALGGYGMGLLAESHQGRPTKLEGNPDHPASLGATDVFAQATVLDLYDPGRSQSITGLGRIRTWGAFVNEVSAPIRALRTLGGEGLRFLSGTVTSPTMAEQMRAILAAYPKARWHRWEAAAPPHAHAGAMAAFGAPHETVYDLTKAKVIVALGTDLLTAGPAAVRYSRDFARGRQVRVDRKAMNRLYAVESTPTNTGTLADHRLSLPPVQLDLFVLALAAELGVAPAAAPGSGGPGGAPALPERARAFAAALAKDLRANAGAAVVAADGFSSPAVQVLAHAMNEALGNVGKTVFHLPPVEADPVDHGQSIAELTRDLDAGRVDMLVVFDANPVYTAPADLDFRQAIQKARLRVHLGLYDDETAELCQWHIPAAHFLESWSDARAFDGTASIAQPLIEPLYGGKSAHELLAVFSDRIDAASYDVVHDYWTKRLGAGASGTTAGAAAFRKALHDGIVPGTAAAPAAASLAPGAAARAAADLAARAAAVNPAWVPLFFRPDPTVYDGRFANNAWLQELPKPLTRLTWDNALLVSPKTAERLKVGVEQVVELAWRGAKVRVPVWVQPGHADGCATLSLGYGRWRTSPVGTGTGANAYALRTSDALAMLPGVGVLPTDERATLASTENHHPMESGADEIPTATRAAAIRRPVRTATLAELVADPEFQHREIAAHPDENAAEQGMTLYPDWSYAGYRWGMAIDLSVCTGCSACVVACQAENNIPTVGKDQVTKGRAMHWLRVDRYFEGNLDDPLLHHQPVPCMQCENAPCEEVCPVAATTHSSEGLNDMVYNRCVGTRYCSNNCPYKVRRFNFLRYSNHDVPVLKLLENPDVTVRMRGVMEKCTYCVQRINGAKIDAEVAGRKVRPGDVQTACQQACPTTAIVFGDIGDPAWEVTRRKADPLNYSLLEELNTRPRTTYLSKLRNENPELAGPPTPPAPRAT